MTPDGRTVMLGRVLGLRRWEAWQLPLEGERTPTPLLTGDFMRNSTEVTPDAKWLVYTSNLSGPWPTVSRVVGRWTASRDSPDGSEIFYRLGTAVMAVDLSTEGGTVRLGRPRELFDDGHLVGGDVRSYHIAPDGRCLMQKAGDAGSGESDSFNQVVLGQNWFEELKRLVPTN